MKQFNPSVFLLMLILLSGCQKVKDTRTTVSGYVVEENSTQKVPNAKVYLVENQYGTYSVGETFLDSTISDAQGFYRFDFDYGSPAGQYKVIAEAPNYYSLYESVGRINLRHHIEVGLSQHYNIKLWPHAWLKIRFLNESGAKGVDVNPFFGEAFGFQVYGVEDAFVKGKVKGNVSNTVNYFVFPAESPNYIPRQKTVYCPGHDTTSLEIIY